VGGSTHPISKGSVKGKIFLSRYESEAQKKAKKINVQARLHFNAKKYNEAYELWQQVKKLLPEHEEAKQGIMEIERIRDEEDRKRKKVLEQKKRALLNLRLNCQLPVEEFNLGMDLIEKSPDKLTEEESKIGRLLEDLIKKKISIHNYLESVRLLRKKPESAWDVSFSYGRVYWVSLDGNDYVRAVRS
jgi:tetratricopeptide (TPR) repeat protein